MPLIPNLSAMKGIITTNISDGYEQLIPSAVVKSFTLEDFTMFNEKNVKKQPAELVQINNESAVIMVIDADNHSIKYYTDKFYLTALQESRNEKVQVVETFGEPNVSFFGERAKTYQGAGILLEADTANRIFPTKYRWASSLARFYEEELRGTELVKKNRIALIYVGNYRLYGYFLNMIMSTNAADSYKKQFSFNFLVKKHELIIKEPLDVLYSLYGALSPKDRGSFLALEGVLKEKTEELNKLNLRLLEIETNQYFEYEQKMLSTNKNLIESIISQTIDEMKSLLSFYANPNLEG